MGERSVTSSRPRRVRRTSIASVILLEALLLGTPDATASTTTTHAAQQRVAYCKLLSSFDKKENAARRVYSSISSSVASMKSAYKSLNAVAVKVMHVAPTALKSTYNKELSALHLVYGDLAKADFDYLSLPESEIMAFESIQSSVTAETKTTTNFDKKYCSARG